MKPHSLLIVDDEQEVLNSLSIALEDEYNVLTASSGMEGLSVLAANAVSLILLDLQMPEMTGLEFLERIRDMEDNTPVLIMTGNSTHEWAKRCADLGVQGYLEKPVDIGVLLERVRKHLAEKELALLKMLWKDEYRSRIASLSPNIKKALVCLRKNIHRDTSREELAAHLNMCPDYLSRQFHKECGFHIREYINFLKMDMAKKYLLETNKSLSEIAKLIDVHDVSYFCKLFKKFTGITPQGFKESNNRKPAS